ncbi:hypothetical protein I4U23_017283 [Adineta vaga]|nr:hypothetical protein I4U23_017283 [Adineta vaga]
MANENDIGTHFLQYELHIFEQNDTGTLHELNSIVDYLTKKTNDKNDSNKKFLQIYLLKRIDLNFKLHQYENVLNDCETLIKFQYHFFDNKELLIIHEQAKWENLKKDTVNRLRQLSFSLDDDDDNDITKQYGQLTEVSRKLNETVTNAIREALDEMKDILNKIKETNEWKQLKVNLETITINGKVSFDVGGRTFSTSVQTLTKEKDTVFTAMISKQGEIEKDDQGRFFIDRDGDLFAEILNYLRNPTNYTLLDEKIRSRLIIEAEFYRLSQLILLLSATRDGFEATTFHNLCNNQGPTMTIIKSTGGYLFGGYASQPWTSAGHYTNTPDSFLFLLKNANGSPPTKFLSHNNARSFYHNAGCGPTFGDGHDLFICNSSNIRNSSCNLGHSYPNSLNLGSNTLFTGIRNRSF